MSLLCEYHWKKREYGVKAGPKTRWREGDFTDNSIILKNCCQICQGTKVLSFGQELFVKCSISLNIRRWFESCTCLDLVKLLEDLLPLCFSLILCSIMKLCGNNMGDTIEHWEHVAKHLEKGRSMFAGCVCTSGTRNIWQSKWNKIHGHGEPWEQHKEHLAKVYHWDKIKDHIWRTHGNCGEQHHKEHLTQHMRLS